MKLDMSDIDDLRPLIAQIVVVILEQLDADRAKLSDRIGFTEPEAAAALGIQRHALRDARLRGEVQASRVGSRIVYRRDQLLALLDRNRLS
jgi:hypothetical protein